jgi:hypothetical protein
MKFPSGTGSISIPSLEISADGSSVGGILVAVGCGVEEISIVGIGSCNLVGVFSGTSLGGFGAKAANVPKPIEAINKAVIMTQVIVERWGGGFISFFDKRYSICFPISRPNMAKKTPATAAITQKAILISVEIPGITIFLLLYLNKITDGNGSLSIRKGT